MENCSSNKLGMKQGEQSLISPAEETKKGQYFLTKPRHHPCFRSPNRLLLQVEPESDELAGKANKTALPKVLEHYYPLAGQLAVSSEGRLMVDCNGEGTVFLGAEANRVLQELGDMTRPDPERLGKLIYDIPGANSILEMPLIVVQEIGWDFLFETLPN